MRVIVQSFNDVAGVTKGTVKDSMKKLATPADASCAGVTTTAVAAPWEPTTMLTVQGIDGPAAAVVEVVRSVAAGAGKTLNVTGFNFAPSPFLRCVWGDEKVVATREHAQTALPAPATFGKSSSVPGAATCADFKMSGGVAAEGGSSRPAMVTAGARRLTPSSSDMFTLAASISEDGKSVTCPMPANAKLGYSRLAVVADRTFTTVPYEFTEEALSCGGGTHLARTG